MKQFVTSKIYMNKEKDRDFDYLIGMLIVMIGYRIIMVGIVPYANAEISFAQIWLPSLKIALCLLLSLGCYYIMKFHFHINQYREEEYLLDALLLGLLLPIHTPIPIIIVSTLSMVLLGRYCFQGILSPVLIGMIVAIGSSILLHILNYNIDNFLQLFTKTVSVRESSLFDVWIGSVEELISQTSPILCMIGLIFFIFKKSMKWRIPIYFIVSYLCLLLISNFFISTTLVEILKSLGVGNILFLSIFVATDKRSTPVTNSGQILFASLLALLTYLGTYFFSSFLAMIVSMLFVTFLVPIFDYFGNYYQIKCYHELNKL